MTSREVKKKPVPDSSNFSERRAVANLSDRLFLTLTGGDRVRYLNGQVTSNVTRLRPGRTQPACVTTAKGRLCAEVFITAQDDALLVDADASLRDSLPARLERYIVADDVALAELPDSTRLMHFLGSEPPDLGLPLIPACRFGIEGLDLWTTAEALETGLFEKITGTFSFLDEAALEAFRIERGVPRWGRELDENTLPPEAGLDRTHVDYHKGCYIGQEVISRLKSVGHVNRQLVGFTSEKESLVPGMQVFAEDAPEKSVGTVTSAAWSFALEKPLALGYLRRGISMHGLTARSDSAAVSISAQEVPFLVS